MTASLRLREPAVKIGETTVHIRQRATSLPSRAEGGRKPGKGRRRRRRGLPPYGPGVVNFLLSLTSATPEPGHPPMLCDVKPERGDITVPDRRGGERLPTFAAPRGFRPAVGSSTPIEEIETIRPRSKSERVSKYAAAMQRRERTFAPV